MTDALKKILMFIISALLLMLVSGLLGGIIGYNRGARHCEELPPADTIVIHKTDTVTLVEVRVDSLIRYVTRLYPVTIHDTIVNDGTIYAELPYEHRFLSQPDTLDIWYSGVDPTIDSVRMYLHHTTEIIRQPYAVTAHKNTIGVCAGLQDASVLYMRDMGKFTAGISAGYTYKGQPTAHAVVGFKF